MIEGNGARPRGISNFPLAGGGDIRYNRCVRRQNCILAALLAAGTATFLYALFKRRPAEEATPYARPAGGEREGEFVLFIGS